MYRSLRMMALAAVITACGLGSAALAQQEQPPAEGQFEGRVDVNEVLLDVLVTDSRGNVIVGLGKDDFVVKENGKPVSLSGVTFYSNRRLVESSAALAKSGVSTEQVPEDRFFILLFEDQKDVAQEAPRSTRY